MFQRLKHLEQNFWFWSSGFGMAQLLKSTQIFTPWHLKIWNIPYWRHLTYILLLPLLVPLLLPLSQINFNQCYSRTLYISIFSFLYIKNRLNKHLRTSLHSRSPSRHWLNIPSIHVTKGIFPFFEILYFHLLENWTNTHTPSLDFYFSG